jgi:glycosyltransferase involved in cell wall biosynthesis
MKVSAVIPTFNSSATICATVESVLRQTAAPYEILVLDDGSTDDTISLLAAYKSQVRVFQQKNQGVAAARNALCVKAQGDLVAFLDHDDVWSPEYIEKQSSLYQRFPNAGAFFTGHVNFYGHGAYRWDGKVLSDQPDAEVLEPVNFLNLYNLATGPFGSMSFCCIPKAVLFEMGNEPFRLSGVDDSYLFCVLPLLGRPVVYTPECLVAYRITEGAQSTNKLKAFGLWVKMFELLRERYEHQSDEELQKAFRRAFSSKRRSYGKILMGAGMVREARAQLWSSLSGVKNAVSRAKSLALLVSTYLPSFLQPVWPKSSRAKIALGAIALDGSGGNVQVISGEIGRDR